MFIAFQAITSIVINYMENIFLRLSFLFRLLDESLLNVEKSSIYGIVPCPSDAQIFVILHIPYLGCNRFRQVVVACFLIMKSKKILFKTMFQDKFIKAHHGVHKYTWISADGD